MLCQFAFKIELIKKSGEVTSPHPARLAARADARGQALGAGGGCPALAGRPPQRHTKPIRGLLLVFLCALCVSVVDLTLILIFVRLPLRANLTYDPFKDYIRTIFGHILKEVDHETVQPD